MASGVNSKRSKQIQKNKAITEIEEVNLMAINVFVPKDENERKEYDEVFGSCSDVTLVLPDETLIHAHRLILMMISRLFRGLLQTPTDKTVLYCSLDHPVESTLAKHMIQYIYRGDAYIDLLFKKSYFIRSGQPLVENDPPKYQRDLQNLDEDGHYSEFSDEEEATWGKAHIETKETPLAENRFEDEKLLLNMGMEAMRLDLLQTHTLRLNKLIDAIELSSSNVKILCNYCSVVGTLQSVTRIKLINWIQQVAYGYGTSIVLPLTPEILNKIFAINEKTDMNLFRKRNYVMIVLTLLHYCTTQTPQIDPDVMLDHFFVYFRAQFEKKHFHALAKERDLSPTWSRVILDHLLLREAGMVFPIMVFFASELFPKKSGNVKLAWCMKTPQFMTAKHCLDVVTSAYKYYRIQLNMDHPVLHEGELNEVYLFGFVNTSSAPPEHLASLNLIRKKKEQKEKEEKRKYYKEYEEYTYQLFYSKGSDNKYDFSPMTDCVLVRVRFNTSTKSYEMDITIERGYVSDKPSTLPWLPAQWPTTLTSQAWVPLAPVDVTVHYQLIASFTGILLNIGQFIEQTDASKLH